MSTMAPSHITIDENGVARIDGTRMKVIHIAKEKVGNSSTPEQMQEAWPHLSLAQIYAALAYYYEHQAELDAQMQRELAEAQQLREQAQREDSPLRKKLRDLGHLK